MMGREYIKNCVLYSWPMAKRKDFCCFICVTWLWALHNVMKKQFFIDLNSQHRGILSLQICFSLLNVSSYCIGGSDWCRQQETSAAHHTSFLNSKWKSEDPVEVEVLTYLVFYLRCCSLCFPECSFVHMFIIRIKQQLHLLQIITLSLIHIWRCRRIERCRSRWSPYH